MSFKSIDNYGTIHKRLKAAIILGMPFGEALPPDGTVNADLEPGCIFYNTTDDKIYAIKEDLTWGLPSGSGGGAWGTITGDISDQLDLMALLADKADLVGGKVPSAQLPSYVDDIIMVADFASLPGVGETGKIYVTEDDNLQYRWTGVAYIQVGGGIVNWGDIGGDILDQIDLQAALGGKADAVLVAYVPAAGTVADGDTLKQAIQKLDANITDVGDSVATVQVGNNLYLYHNFR
jgi:hypothetical protein